MITRNDFLKLKDYLMTWKSFLLVLFALGVVACQAAGYKNTATQPVDRSYKATLHLNDEAITKAGFLTIRGVETTANTVQATCLRTSKPWDAPCANAGVSFKGDPYNQYERY